MSIQVETLPVGMLAVNCYLVWAPETRQALIIDPGDDPDEVAAAVRQAKLTPKGILLTHAHVDHIRGVAGVAAAFAVPVFVHADDRALYLSPDNALPPWVEAATGLPEPVATPPQLDGVTYTIVHTPGHTPGGVCYYFAESAMLFSGDTLFAGSIGRTDLPGGDFGTLMRSLKTRLASLPADTVVYPGHGPATRIGEEKESNPYLG